MLRVLQIANPRVSPGPLYKLGGSVTTCISASCAAVDPGIAWIPHITPIRAYDAARYSTTSFAAGGDNSSKAAFSSSRTYFVQREGDPGWAEVIVSPSSTVAALIKAIKVELPSLTDVDATDIALHRADVDDDGNVKALESTALPSRKSLKALNLADGSSIVVKVPPTFSTAADFSEVPADDEVSQVVAAIREGKVEEDEHGHLVLPEGVKWPVATSNTLFVRKFYAPLFEHVLNKCLPGPVMDYQQRRIVTGQPGIGKSVWGWYVIYRLLTEQRDRTVVYASHKDKKSYIMRPKGPIIQFYPSEQNLSKLNGQNLGRNPILIADSLVPPVQPFWTLIISSPGRLADPKLTDVLNEYKTAKLYMPIPSEEELLHMRSVAFPTLPEDGVKQRLQLWGPIPRLVLVKIDEHDQEDYWVRAATTPLNKVIALAREGASNDVIPSIAPHRLVHERARGQDAPDGTPASNPKSVEFYKRGNVVIASPPLLRHLVKRIEAESMWNAAFLIDISAGIGPLATLRGIKFEEAVLAMLHQGSTFDCRVLAGDAGLKENARQQAPTPTVDSSESVHDADVSDDESFQKVCFKPSTRMVWSKAEELSQYADQPHTLLVPSNRQVAGLDALVWVDGATHHAALDSTVAESHGLHVQSLANAVNALGWTRENGWPSQDTRKKRDRQIKYYWAVPEDQFDNGWQEPHSPKKDSMKTDLAKAAFRVTKQIVLRVPRMLQLKFIRTALQQQGVPFPAELLKGVNELYSKG